MESSKISKSCMSKEVTEPRDEFQELLDTLPKQRHFDGPYRYHYKDFWCSSYAVRGIIPFQRHFEAHDSDILLATLPKSGTTWLKALIFSIVNRTKFPLSQSPLLTTNPHELVRFFEFDLYSKDEKPNLEDLPCPRIFATHVPYNALPQSIVNSRCRIVYIGRNPLDQFISYWHFVLKNQYENSETFSLDEGFELFCRGIQNFGPFWDHVLGYWGASIESQKVLFLKYEDLKEDVTSHVRKLAEFMGFPFSVEEEKQELVKQISNLCSFENLKNLEVNRVGGRLVPVVQYSSLFRKGQVGDWANHLSPSMADRLEKIMEEKLGGSGLTFNAF
ncbi:unnamed protein product [Ilex paraguariensis]|uniref:Sulfotransferase n=1 Tax=Ilex paraguariensis TaxID=185542 RepID=A0ABC8SI26_9AQUA